MRKMITYDFFYKASMAEKGGFGIWYEYLAKSRIFRKFYPLKNVLIFGLPEKYSLGLDTLLFTENSSLTVLEDRKKELLKYQQFAKKFNKKINIKLVSSLKKFKSSKKYDLIVSTEVLQNNISLISTIKRLAKKIIIFVPNKQCYAHPKISGLKSISLKELRTLGLKHGLKIIDSGYIDCPPWPAGACLSKSEGKIIKESWYLKIIKEILMKITPFLSKLDSYYLSPWKEINSHMIYCVFKNE